MRSAGCFFVFFGLFWSAITLTFDVLIARTVYQRLNAENFPTVPGRVTQSEVISSRGSRGGTAYKPKVFFSYEVNGQPYVGNQFHFGDMSTSNSRRARAVVAAHPPGREVRVHYDPADPNRAVLNTGLEGDELFMALFITPFNCVMLGIWLMPLAGLRASREAGGVRLATERFHTRATMSEFRPVHAALAGAAAGAFAMVFLAGLPTGFNPSLRVATGAWCVPLAVAIIAFFRRHQRLRSGKDDLVIDDDARLLTLPCNQGRKQPRQTAFAEVAAITVQRHRRSSSKGTTSYTFSPALELRDGRIEELANWSNERKAEQFAAWLRNKLGVTART